MEESYQLTGKGLLLTALLLPHEEGDKLLFMLELAAKRLAKNGLCTKHLEEFTGQSFSNRTPIQHWVAIAEFVQQIIADDVILAASFAHWVYQKGFFSDLDSVGLFEEMKCVQSLCH